MDKTAGHDKHIVNFGMAYGGREEITDSVKYKCVVIVSNNSLEKSLILKNVEVYLDEVNSKSNKYEGKTINYYPLMWILKCRVTEVDIK